MTVRIIILLLTLSCSSLLFAENRAIRLATVEYSPYHGDSLLHGGPVTEIITAAFKQQGYKVIRKQMPWSRALQATQKGDYDGIYTAWYRKDREKDFIFSTPLVKNELVFFIRADDYINFDGYDSLKNFQIGVVRDYALPPGFEEANLQVQLANSDKQNLNKLAAGRIHLALLDRAQGKHILRTQLPELQHKLKFIDPPANVETNHLMFSKAVKDAEFIAKQFETGLSAIKSSGLMDKILKRHNF